MTHNDQFTTMRTAKITATTTPALLAAAATPLRGRHMIDIYNASAGDVYIGPAGVTTDTGLGIPTKGSKRFNIAPGEGVALYVVAASSAELRVAEYAQ